MHCFEYSVVIDEPDQNQVAVLSLLQGSLNFLSLQQIFLGSILTFALWLTQWIDIEDGGKEFSRLTPLEVMIVFAVGDIVTHISM